MIGAGLWNREGFAAVVLCNLALYLFMNLGPFAAHHSCVRWARAVSAFDMLSVTEDHADHLGLSLCLLSLVAFRRCWVSFARVVFLRRWADHQ